MVKTIWDLKKGDKVLTVDGVIVEVLEPTVDGSGFVARYLEGQAKGQDDFIFENEVRFSDE